MKKFEFVSKNGCAVVDVTISTRLECKCGKASLVELDTDLVHGYYDSVSVFLEIECPHCHEKYEKELY